MDVDFDFLMFLGLCVLFCPVSQSALHTYPHVCFALPGWDSSLVLVLALPSLPFPCLAVNPFPGMT